MSLATGTKLVTLAGCAVCHRAVPLVFEKWCRHCIEDADMSPYVRAPGRSNWQFGGEQRLALLRALARLHGSACPYCLDDVDTALAEGKFRPTVDHVIAVAEGGTNVFSNLRLAHWICNSKDGLRRARNRRSVHAKAA